MPSGTEASVAVTPSSGGEASSVLLDFVTQFHQDLESGSVRPLSHDLTRFPGHEEAVAEEYLDLLEAMTPSASAVPGGLPRPDARRPTGRASTSAPAPRLLIESAGSRAPNSQSMPSPRPKSVPVLLLALLLGTGPVACRSAPVRPDDGRLPPCPASPNCVNSQEGGLQPLEFTGSVADAMATLRMVVTSMPRTTIVEEAEDYLHVTYRTALFRFVDDVQFLVDADAGLIHVRSASRLGVSDLGTNRRRVEEIRLAWQASR